MDIDYVTEVTHTVTLKLGASEAKEIADILDIALGVMNDKPEAAARLAYVLTEIGDTE